MKVAILGTRGIPARYGGFETFAEQLSVRLAARGHDVTVYGRAHFVDAAFDGHRYCGVAIRVLPTIRSKYLDTVIHTLLCAIDCLWRDFDIVLICNAANSCWAAVPRLRGMRVIVNVDGIERLRRKWGAAGKAYYRLGEWVATRLPHAIVADALVIQRYYRDAYGAASTMIPYGADVVPASGTGILDRLGVRPGEYVLYVSRLEPENNADIVIRAFQTLSTSLRLVVVGDAPYATRYVSDLRRLARNDARVVLAGFVFGEGYRELQSHAACYVQATEVGGTHPALVEAMGYGNCVIANDTAENREVGGDTIGYYRFNDCSDLANQLRAVIDDAGLRHEYGGRAQARVRECYSWEDVTTQYEELFQRVRAGRK